MNSMLNEKTPLAWSSFGSQATLQMTTQASYAAGPSRIDGDVMNQSSAQGIIDMEAQLGILYIIMMTLNQLIRKLIVMLTTQLRKTS
jgi:hypothetical protein